MAAAAPKVALPGQQVLQVPDSGQLRLGPGLIVQGDGIAAIKAGVVRQAKGQLWLEGRSKRYVPQEEDLVVGTVLDRHGENLTVDIGAPTLAVLPQLSFEGATKRNRPAVKAGDLVYARVVSASRDTDPILSCVDAFGRASGFGALKEGLPLQVSTALARQLLAQPPAPVLQQLGQLVQFELAVGMNGRVWVCAPEELWKSSFVAQAITQSEYLNAAQVHVLVHQMWERVKDKAETKAMET